MAINGSNFFDAPLAERSNIYEFGSFRLDAGQRILTLEGQIIRLSPKMFELLLYFVEHPNQVIEKDTLMREVWRDAIVEDANLTVHISNLRKALNGDLGRAVSIETFPKVGYRFSAEVSTLEQEIADRKPSSADRVELIVDTRSRSKAAIMWVAAAAIVSVIGGIAFWVATPTPTRVPLMIRVAGTENSASIALSPDGQYIAHAISKFGKRALTMTNVGSGSSVQLIPPDDSLYYGMKFSRDNSYLYFVRLQNDQFTLDRIPVLGGQIVNIMNDSPQEFAISPDGSKICYVRRLPNGVSSMNVANSDGTGEREIAQRMTPDNYSVYDIAWSPDGMSIADLAHHGEEDGSKLITIDIETGKETFVSDKSWAGGDGLAWLPDGSGLVGGLNEAGNSPTQVWLVPLKTGEPQKITTDLENYGGIDISADGQTIIAGQFKDESSLWVQPLGKPNESRPVTNEKHHMFRWVRWLGERDLVFASSIGPNRDVWAMDTQGLNERQITSEAKNNIMPAAARDGTTIYFCSNRAGKGVFNIYRTTADRQKIDQLTFGDGEFQPAVSPDGKWIYYTAGNPDGDELKRTIWKIPTDGGCAIQVSAKPSFYPSVSHDGRSIAFWLKQADDQPWKVAIMKADGSGVAKLLDIPRPNPIAWTADDTGITFIKTIDGVSNLWTQPVGGGAPLQETRFTSDQITNFDWSVKGELVCSRTGRRRDVYLIRNFR